jgi:Transposase DNA-binding
MSDWIETELAEGQMHDVRHTKRLARLLDRLRTRPISSIPAACHGWAETVVAYRFLDTPAIGIQDILSGHTHATLERIRAQEVVLLVQDTTCLDYGTTHPKGGMGTVKIKVHEEYLLHPTVALTPERVNLGVVGMKVWQRPEQPVAQQRKSQPMAEKERYRCRQRRCLQQHASIRRHREPAGAGGLLHAHALFGDWDGVCRTG